MKKAVMMVLVSLGVAAFAVGSAPTVEARELRTEAPAAAPAVVKAPAPAKRATASAANPLPAVDGDAPPLCTDEVAPAARKPAANAGSGANQVAIFSLCYGVCTYVGGELSKCADICFGPGLQQP